MSRFTKQQFISFYPGSKDAAACYDAVDKALTEAGINTQLTLIGALATIRVEVGRSFKPVRERASGSAYEGRKDLGNTQKGDGVRFKGRGYIQITGRSNYTGLSRFAGVDYVKNPDLLLNIADSARSVAWYFKTRKVNVACDKHKWATVRYLVNGGSNGLDTFLSVVSQYLLKTK